MRASVVMALAVTVSLTHALSAAADPTSFEANWSQFRGNQPKGLRLEMQLSKTRFYQGEAMPVGLAFVNDSMERFQIETGTHDRSGRIQDIGFCAEDNEGRPVEDPLAWYFIEHGGVGGGIGGSAELGHWNVTLTANQWVNFDKPGRYKLFAWATRVYKGTDSFRQSLGSIPLVSDLQEMEIVSSPIHDGGVRPQRGSYFDSFLDDIASPNPHAKAQEILASVRDPSVGVDQMMLFLYPKLMSYRPPSAEEVIAARQFYPFLMFYALPPMTRSDSSSHENKDEIYFSAKNEITAAVRDAFPKKQGEAYPTTLLTLYGLDPKNTEIHTLMVSHQEALSAAQLNQFVAMWPQWGGTEFLPLLRRAVHSLMLIDASNALAILSKLAPDDARLIILEDIRRPQHRYTIPVLCSLPDKELPELEPFFAEQLKSPHANLFYLVPLIARYASPKLLPEAIRFYQTVEGTWACSIQAAAIQYWIRCESVGGLAALGRALQARGQTACFKNVLSDVLLDHWVPEARPLVLTSLSDEDSDVVRSAIEVLRKHSPDDLKHRGLTEGSSGTIVLSPEDKGMHDP